MALTPNARRDRKVVDQFLNSGSGQTSGFLEKLDRNIATNRVQRRAAQQANRAIGAGPFQGNSPFRNSPMVNPSGMGGRQIVQQGMGNIPPVGGRPALPPGGTGGGLVPTGNMPVPTGNMPVPTGNLPVPTGKLPANLPQGPAVNVGNITPVRPAVGPGPTAGPAARGPIAGTTRALAAQTDDLVNIAGQAAAQGADDVAGAAARQAGAAQAKAGATGLRSAVSNLGVNVTKTSLMRGAGVAGTGYMVSQFIDGLNIGGEQSILDKGGSSAIMGAGLGGGAALALGLGTGPAGWAALGGAALFGVSRALWGGDDTKLETATKAVGETRDTILELAGMYGIEGSALDDIMLQYEASTSLLIDQKDTAGLKNFMAGISTSLPALMLQAREQQKAQDQEQKRYESMMQAQAQFAPIFEQALNRASQSNLRSTAQANNTASYLDQNQPQLAALYRTTAAQSEAAAANLQAAYARQMAAAPITTGTTDQLQRQLAQEELMNQQIAQSAQYAGF